MVRSKALSEKRAIAIFAPNRLAQAVAGALIVGFAPTSLHALPEGGQVTAGSAAIQRSGATLTVNQATDRAAIDWQSFGVAAAEAVRFNQPGASSVVLNRVLGQNPSQIFGSLSANGQVFLLNPNGVLFAQGAQVSVGALVASTLTLSDADFLAGRYTFSKGTNAGSVVNQGTITAGNGGYVALIGPRVVNEGVIGARLGTVALAAGDQVTLNLNGNSLVSIAVDRGVLDALASNHQLISAGGGQVSSQCQGGRCAGPVGRQQQRHHPGKHDHLEERRHPPGRRHDRQQRHDYRGGRRANRT